MLSFPLLFSVLLITSRKQLINSIYLIFSALRERWLSSLFCTLWSMNKHTNVLFSDDSMMLPAWNAPTLNLMRAFAFVHVPSGKMMVCGKSPSWVCSARRFMLSNAIWRDSLLLRFTIVNCGNEWMVMKVYYSNFWLSNISHEKVFRAIRELQLLPTTTKSHTSKLKLSFTEKYNKGQNISYALLLLLSVSIITTIYPDRD